MRDGEQGEGTLLEPGRVRPTRRLLVVPTLGVILWGAGANAGAGFLVVLAAGLVASVPWAFWTAVRAARGVRVRRVLPATAVAGEVTKATLHLQVAVLGGVVVHDALTRAVGVVDVASEGAALDVQARLGRGLPTTGVVTVEVTDPFGLFRVVVAGEVPARIDVLPPTHLVAVPTLVSAARTALLERPRRRGQGSETDGTREYRHGDSPRAVDWRSSARREELIVREFVGETAGRVRVSIQPGTWERASLDAACAVAASLAESSSRAGAASELGVGDRVMPWDLDGPRLLASLTPSLAAEQGRGLPTMEPAGGVVTTPAPVEVLFRPVGSACQATVLLDGTARTLGTLPVEVDSRDLVLWVVDRLSEEAA